MNASASRGQFLPGKIGCLRQEPCAAIRYLGQSGFLLQLRGVTVAIDPYLTDTVDRLPDEPSGLWVRQYPPPVDPASLHGVDLVLVTHDHLDHLDPATLSVIAAAAPHCRFAGPRLCVEGMKKAGLPGARLTCLNEGHDFVFHEVRIEPVAAAHEDYESDADGFHRFLGYLIHAGGLTLYHSGDTVSTPQLSRTLARHRIDVGFLPINGRNEKRHRLGIIGNMNAEEALALAAVQKFDLLVPTHYDLYPNNGASLSDFIAHWERQPQSTRPRIKAFRPGEKIIYQKADQVRPLAVIIGAGKTGRGFLARLVEGSPCDLAFIDRDAVLVRRISEDGGYAIHFFGGERAPFRIDGVPAFTAGSEEAIACMAHANIIFTAVGESNVDSLVPDFERALARRSAEGLPKLRVLVCENGPSPAAPLRYAFGDRAEQIEIAEAAIFCSTIELPGTRLDIQSEAYDELPYDRARVAEFTGFPGLRPVDDFPTLLLRKIYTYNCFSACIAYLGAYKGYKWYADAAGDPEISVLLERIAGPLNRAICRTYKVKAEEQDHFSEAALRKFRDENIRDDIARNARNVMRKLSADDRLVAPARLILEDGGDIRMLAFTMAAALLYREPEEKALAALLVEKPAAEVFAQISGYPPESAVNQLVTRYYEALQLSKNRRLADIVDSVLSTGGKTA